MFGKYFEYNGETSKDYNLKICSFNSIEIPMGLGREIIKGETTKFCPIANHLGTRYSDVLSFSVSFAKYDRYAKNQTVLAFTEEEINDIMAWLTSPCYPTLFRMVSDNRDEKNYNYFGVFTDMELFHPVGEMVHGFTATFTTNAPYAWTDEIVKSCSSTTSIDITIDCKTAERLTPIYPVIVVTPHNNGNVGRLPVSITTKEGKTLSLNLPKIPVTIDCGKTKIYDHLGLVSFEDLGLADVGEVYWPRLWYGINAIKITGDTDIQFRYREPRKVGAY
jgi:hypothetical protein